MWNEKMISCHYPKLVCKRNLKWYKNKNYWNYSLVFFLYCSYIGARDITCICHPLYSELPSFFRSTLYLEKTSNLYAACLKCNCNRSLCYEEGLTGTLLCYEVGLMLFALSLFSTFYYLCSRTHTILYINWILLYKCKVMCILP